MDELYLVTGASGHLGSAVILKLAELNKKFRILLMEGEKYSTEGDFEISYGNVCNKNSLNSFFENRENRELIVIHCAGIVSIASKYDQKVYDVNVTGTKNIVDLCVSNHVKKLVYISSVHAIPEKPKGQTITEVTHFDPAAVVGLYAQTKAEATAYVLAAAKKGLNACVIHPSGIFGPYDRGHGHLTTLIIDFCKKRLTAGVNGGYDFVDVRDVADGIIAACEVGGAGECYILSNRFFTVREILSMLHEITAIREITVFLPLWFVKLTAPLSELYYKLRKQPPIYSAYSIYTLNTNAAFSHEKATSALSYQPRDMRQTLTDTVFWLKQNKRI